MKYFTLICCLLFSINQYAQYTVFGTVQTEEGTPIVEATVKISEPFAIVQTDVNGRFEIEADTAHFIIQCFHENYDFVDRRFDAKVNSECNFVLVALDSPVPAMYETVTEMVLVKPESTRIVKPENGSRMFIEETIPAEYKTITRRVITSPASTRSDKPPLVEYTEKAIKSPPKVKGSSSRKSVKKAGDRNALTTNPEDSKVLVLEEVDASDKKLPGAKKLAAGQLTAGEWRDLDHWTYWNKLMADPSFQDFEKEWKINTHQRYSVQVESQNGKPLVNCKLQLLSNDEVVWETKTDNKGKAELWANLFEDQTAVSNVNLIYNGKSFVRKINPYEKGLNIFRLPVSCHNTALIEVFFAIDATGSMADELRYLQAEIQDVIEQAKANIEDAEIRVGALVYRDEKDNYLTRSTPLTTDLDSTIQFLQLQLTGGGGDFPEAVDIALEESMKEDWSDEAVCRILFLVLDAPPHQGDENYERMQIAIRNAAKLGIKIVPVASSGINKSTEFLMKMISMVSNASYVFLTDHSGIGNAHLKPTVESYNVETLNDLMLRLIMENSETEPCLDDNINDLEIIQAQEPIDETLQHAIHIFPNPAANYTMLDCPVDLQSIQLLNEQGQLIKQMEQVQAGNFYLSLDNLAAGLYFIRFQEHEGKIAFKKLIVIQQ